MIPSRYKFIIRYDFRIKYPAVGLLSVGSDQEENRFRKSAGVCFVGVTQSKDGDTFGQQSMV